MTSREQIISDLPPAARFYVDLLGLAQRSMLGYAPEDEEDPPINSLADTERMTSIQYRTALQPPKPINLFEADHGMLCNISFETREELPEGTYADSRNAQFIVLGLVLLKGQEPYYIPGDEDQWSGINMYDFVAPAEDRPFVSSLRSNLPSPYDLKKELTDDQCLEIVHFIEPQVLEVSQIYASFRD